MSVGAAGPAPDPRARRLLLVSLSARMLAASAARAGFETLALDLFGDRDLAALARDHEVVRPAIDCGAGKGSAEGSAGGFDPQDLIACARRLLAKHGSAELVCGAGLEDQPALLDSLSALEGLASRGNGAVAIEAVKDPRRLAALLQALGIAHPEIRRDVPDDPAGWLAKRAGGCGGVHVQEGARAAQAECGAGADRYFQRFQPGRSLSALLLADGRRALVVGISAQYVRAREPHDYAFTGAAGPVPLSDRLAERIRDCATRIVAATALRGCIGIDFIVDDDEMAWVIEINPRPPATIELYDADWPRGLVDAHLRALAGELPAAAASPTTAPTTAPTAARALRIAWAPHPWVAGEVLALGGDCTDLPRPGARIGENMPLCTVHAQAADADAAWRAVSARCAAIEASLQPSGGRDPDR